MGGKGSGSWYRWDKKSTLEEVRRIDIRYLKSQRFLEGYTSGTLSWNCGGEPRGLINFTHSNDVLTLNYKYREYGGEWQSAKQTINILKTPCHYGGFRKWLECPYCKRRVGILAGADVYYACRHCYKLSYGSQQETHSDRIIRAKHKMGERIFEQYEHGDGWMKKKGMNQKTFDRHYRKYQMLEQQWNADMLMFCQRQGLLSEASLFDPHIP